MSAHVDGAVKRSRVFRSCRRTRSVGSSGSAPAIAPNISPRLSRCGPSARY